MTALVLAQAETDTASGAALIFGVLVLIGVVATIGISGWGRRNVMPLVAILIGGLIGATTLSDAIDNGISVLTLLSAFITVVLVAGGIGALREGVTLPDVTPSDDNDET